MSFDDVAMFAWIVWLGLILVFLVIEIFTVDFTFLMIAVGSVGGLVSSLFGVPWLFQLVIAGALAIVLIFAVRPPLQRALRRGEDPTKSNISALIGLAGTVVAGYTGAPEQVKLANGEVWTLRTTDGSTPSLGDSVVVTFIDGATAVVSPVHKTAP